MPVTIFSRKIDGRTFSVEVPTVERVPGEVGVAAEVVGAVECAIASAIVLGPPSAAGFKFVRRALGLTAVRLAELLGVRAESISRWENSVVPFDRATWIALGDLALERVGRPVTALARMEGLAAGAAAPKQVHVELAMMVP